MNRIPNFRPTEFSRSFLGENESSDVITAMATDPARVLRGPAWPRDQWLGRIGVFFGTVGSISSIIASVIIAIHSFIIVVINSSVVAIIVVVIAS